MDYAWKQFTKTVVLCYVTIFCIIIKNSCTKICVRHNFPLQPKADYYGFLCSCWNMFIAFQILAIPHQIAKTLIRFIIIINSKQVHEAEGRLNYYITYKHYDYFSIDIENYAFNTVCSLIQNAFIQTIRDERLSLEHKISFMIFLESAVKYRFKKMKFIVWINAMK